MPGQVPFALYTVFFLCCALWEWLRLTSGDPRKDSRFVPGMVSAVVLAAVLLLAQFSSSFPEMVSRDARWIWMAASAVWLLAVLPMLRTARADAPPRHLGWSAFSWLAIVAAWSAINAAYSVGFLFLMSLVSIVWVADIGAYFAGKRFGRRKLALHISPGKTIEGAIGGILAAIVLTVISAFIPGTFGEALSHKWTLPGAAFIGLVLAGLSIAGDLFESLLKRRAGRKDSSGLLPGHGGVLDRVDAMLPVLPLALLLV